MKAELANPLVPFCYLCGTARFLMYENFAPPQLLPSGHLLTGGVNYTCMQCGQFSGHNIPAGWRPPE